MDTVGYWWGASSGRTQATRWGAAGLMGVMMLALAFVLLAPTSSLAADRTGGMLPPGVHVDPNSPAGKEYAIPLGQARSVGGSSSLFGSGITKPPSGSAGVPAPTATPSGPDFGVAKPPPATRSLAAHRRAGAAASGIGSFRPRGAGTSMRGPGPREAGTGGLDWMLGAAALVLALGAVGGEALARALRRGGLHAGR